MTLAIGDIVTLTDVGLRWCGFCADPAAEAVHGRVIRIVEHSSYSYYVEWSYTGEYPGVRSSMTYWGDELQLSVLNLLENIDADSGQ